MAERAAQGRRAVFAPSLAAARLCFFILIWFTKALFNKMVINGNDCPEIFQIGYTDKKKLRAVVMKGEFEAGMEIFHKPGFESKENLEEFIKKQWVGSKIIHHKSLKSLQ